MDYWIPIFKLVHGCTDRLGLIMGAGEGVGGVISPALAGYAADLFGLRAPLWIMFALPIVASLLALGLEETAPGRATAHTQLRRTRTSS